MKVKLEIPSDELDLAAVVLDALKKLLRGRVYPPKMGTDGQYHAIVNTKR